MANNISNLIILKGEQSQIDEIKKLMTIDPKSVECNVSRGSDPYDFDFDAIIPMPKDLDITESSNGSNGMDYIRIMKKDECDRTEEEVSFCKKFEESRDFKEGLELGQNYIDNLENYGFQSWYRWRIFNWGTKWNSYEVVWKDNLVCFETAWSPCLPIVEELSTKFPEVVFYYRYYDLDSYCGMEHCFAIDGVVYEGWFDEAYEAYNNATPYEECKYYKNENGEWNNHEDDYDYELDDDGEPLFDDDIQQV